MDTKKSGQPSDKPDWHELRHQILASLDLRAEAELLGVKFCGESPNGSGWLSCHAVDREDRSPSAAVCVAGKNGTLGLYKDLGGGSDKAISFFELAAKLGKFHDWREARRHYADQAGIKIPGDDFDANEQVQWRPWNRNTARAWCEQYKKGITLDQLEAFGARLCRWPIKIADPYTCIALPGYRDADGDPAAWVLYRTDGQEFPAFESTKKHVKARKCHNLRDGKDAWLNAGGPEAWATATRFWKCEGPTDAIALQAILPPGELAISNAVGCKADLSRVPLTLFASKPVIVCPDADKPGQDGAEKHARSIAASGAGETRIIRLPFPVAEKHGKDLRDFICEEGTYSALLEFVDSVEPIDPAEAAKPAHDVENYQTVYNGDKAEKHCLPLSAIAKRIHDSRDGWPRSISGLLFVEGRPSGRVPDLSAIRPISNPNDLFAWLRETGQIRWTKAAVDATPANREELFSYLCANAREHYRGVAYLPHHPKISGLHYVEPNLPESTGEALTEFLDHLNPETSTDRDLLLAAMLTLGWGGPAGQRPAFLMTSKHGRGAGKTKTAEAIAEIWGGAISANLSSKKHMDEFRSRLLDDSGLACRAALIDNVKGVISSSEIESLITTKVIDGKRMYHGDYRRDNYLTWFVTANSPSLSKDLADRSVVIKIGKPKVDDFGGWVDSFLSTNRPALLADLFAILEGPDRCEISRGNLDRWNAWQRAILAKFPNGDKLAVAIRDTRPTVDVDSEEAEHVAEEIEKMIRGVKIDGDRLDPALVYIAIPVTVLYSRLREMWGDKNLTDRMVRFRLNEMLGTAPLSCLQPNPSRHYGPRTMLWIGRNWTSTEGEDIRPDYPWSEEWRIKNGKHYDFDQGGTKSVF